MTDTHSESLDDVPPEMAMQYLQLVGSVAIEVSHRDE